MLYYLSQALLEWSEGTVWAEYLSPLRLFRYITVRSAGAAVTALGLSWWLGPKVIAWLKRLKFGQDYADRAEEAGGLAARVLSKKGTPTMGGLLIITVLNVTTLLWAQWNTLIQLTLLSVLVLTALGFYDDYAKILQQSGGGTKPHVKLWVQFALAAFVAVYLWQLPLSSYLRLPESTASIKSNLISVLMVPFYKYPIQAGAVVGLLVAVFAIVGMSNAVNLTDGLDGLAIMPAVFLAVALGIFAYATGNTVFANYLGIPYIAGTGELIIFCAALAGAGLGFLWFNTYPAQVFMGDIGALAMGAALGLIAVLVRQELVFCLMAGVFVMETVSVILQVLSFKLTGKRIFRMAPIHHHFELKGWPEPRVIVRFWIITVVLVLMGLATLKIR